MAAAQPSPGQPPAAALALGADAAQQRAGWRDYLTLTKPRVMSLLLLTTVAAMVAGAGGEPGVRVLVAAVIGGALASGGASAINHVLDRDIDRVMGARTQGRPVAAGRIAPARALAFGCGLTAAAFLVFATEVNLLSAVLALVGGAVYVFVYTVWLKRLTPQNIVIGGVAGAIPPLVGWAAATGSISGPAWVMFAIVTLWTPPHFWALALMLQRHYADAGVPMMPVVRGAKATARQILGYALLLVPVSLAPAMWPAFGVPYLVVAAVLNLALIGLCLAVARDPGHRAASRLFHFSLLYLALLFVAMAVTAAL